MNELKAKLKALASNIKFLISAGGGVLIVLLFLVIPQLSVYSYGVSVFDLMKYANAFGVMLILGIIILPLVNAVLIFINKKIMCVFSWITLGLIVTFGLYAGVDSYAGVSFGWFNTLILGIAWAICQQMLNGEDASLDNNQQNKTTI